MATVIVGWQGPVTAGEWRLTPSLSLEEAFSDNVRSAQRGQEEADLISRGTTGLSLRGQGGRVSFNGTYSLNRLNYLDNTDLNEFRHQLTAAGTAELVADRLSVDVQGSISQQIINPQGPVTGSELNANPNRDTVQTYNLTPVYRQHFGSWAELDARVRLSQTFGGSGGGGALSDTFTETATVRLDSGRRFTSLRWGLSLGQERSDPSDGGSATTSYDAALDLEYRFSAQYAVTATLGTQTIDDDTLREQPSGLFWTAGFLFDPGPRTSLKVTYGDRYETEDLEFSLSYRLGAKTTLLASYTETIRRSSTELADQLSGLTVDENGNFIFADTGLPFVAGNREFGVGNNAFRQERFGMTVTGTRGRTSFNAQAFYEKRTTEATGSDETVLGGSANLSRTLTRNASGSVGITYETTDFGGLQSREDDLFTANLSYSYRFTQDVSASLSYTFTDRSSTLASNELRENVATLRVTKSF